MKSKPPPQAQQAASAATAIVPSLNSAERSRLSVCEATIQQHLGTFVQVGLALAEIRNSALYRETHKSFEDYCRDKWDIARQHAYRLIDAAKVAEVVSAATPPSEDVTGRRQLPASEWVVRPLVALPENKQTHAWATAVSRAREQGKPVTGAIVEAVVKEMMAPPPLSEGRVAPPPPAYACPNCGGHERDEDGDCKKCHEPTGDPPEVDDSAEAAMKAADSKIEQFCRKLTKMADEEMPDSPWLRQNGRKDLAHQKIKDACSTLRTCKGSALCPKCNGEGCKRCLDTGYVTKLVLEQLK
jgi:hypothetical protein